MDLSLWLMSGGMLMAVKITGNAIEVIGKVKQDFSPASVQKFIKKATLYQVFSTKQNFVKESDPDGNKWKGLAKSTLRQKRNTKILRGNTLRLINGIQPQVLSTKGIVRSTNAPYGIFHQTGTRKMDARVFLGIGENDVEKITKIAEDIFFDDL